MHCVFAGNPTENEKVILSFHAQGETEYNLWYPRCIFKKPKSPFTYTSKFQRIELLHRSGPISAVVQKSGKKILRVYVINSGLRDRKTGKLVAYLTGLYKYKVILKCVMCDVIVCNYVCIYIYLSLTHIVQCNNHPIWSNIYSIASKETIVFRKLTVKQIILMS